MEEYSRSNMLRGNQEHVCYMLLEQFTFQIWFRSIFDFEYSSRLLMVQDHIILKHMVLGQKSRPRSQEIELSMLSNCCVLPSFVVRFFHSFLTFPFFAPFPIHLVLIHEFVSKPPSFKAIQFCFVFLFFCYVFVFVLFCLLLKCNGYSFN